MMMRPIPYLQLGQFGQLLLHVLLQLSRLQNGLADGTNWGLSVVQTLQLGCRQWRQGAHVSTVAWKCKTKPQKRRQTQKRQCKPNTKVLEE